LEILNKTRLNIELSNLKYSSLNHNKLWEAFIDKKMNKTINIEGFGIILNSNIFDIKTKYTPNESFGIFDKIREKLAFFF
jgi:hypothetical protein